MYIFRSLLLSSFLCSLLIGITSAQAGPTTWDFRQANFINIFGFPVDVGQQHSNPLATVSDGETVNAYGMAVTRTPAVAGSPARCRFGLGTFPDCSFFGSIPAVDPSPEVIGDTFAAGVHQNGNGLGVLEGDLIGQIDNIGNTIEFIVLELPSDSWVPISLTLSLATDIIGEDEWQILGTDTLTPTDPASIANDLAGLTALATGDSSGSSGGELTIDFSDFGVISPFNYLVIAGDPFTFNEDDGFRIASFTGVQVPEPGMLAVFGLGLLGLGYLRRRRTEV